MRSRIDRLRRPDSFPPCLRLWQRPLAALPAGYTRARSYTIHPVVIAWLPAVLLVVTLICTFAPWVGMYVGGYPAYSQGPWRSRCSARPNPNPPLVATMQTLGNWNDHFNSDWN